MYVGWAIRALITGLLFTTQLASEAHAQLHIGTVSLYADSNFTETTVVDTVPRVLRVYVVHKQPARAYYGIQFKVAESPGFTGTWVTEESPFVVAIGTSQTGISIAYGSCLAPPTHLLTMLYVLDGKSVADSYVEAQAHPGAEFSEIEAYLCAGMWDYPAGGRLEVKPNVVPIEETTWGRIKVIYKQ